MKPETMLKILLKQCFKKFVWGTIFLSLRLMARSNNEKCCLDKMIDDLKKNKVDFFK